MIWHLCRNSDGKHYIIHKCCSFWQATYQCKGSMKHRIRAQVLVPRREQRHLHELISLSNIPCSQLNDHFHCLPVKWGRNRKFITWLDVNPLCMTVNNLQSSACLIINAHKASQKCHWCVMMRCSRCWWVKRKKLFLKSYIESHLSRSFSGCSWCMLSLSPQFKNDIAH